MFHRGKEQTTANLSGSIVLKWSNTEWIRDWVNQGFFPLSLNQVTKRWHHFWKNRKICHLSGIKLTSSSLKVLHYLKYYSQLWYVMTWKLKRTRMVILFCLQERTADQVLVGLYLSFAPNDKWRSEAMALCQQKSILKKTRSLNCL